MSYSTHNSTMVSVTNFGALGNNVTNDTAAFQRAHDSLLSRGGGTIFVPRGDYLTSGYINITGNNISMVGEPGLSWIRTAPSGDFRKINISGASGISLVGLGINGGRTSGVVKSYIPMVNVFNSSFSTIRDCYLGRSESVLVQLRGTSSDALIENNVFEDFHIGLNANGNDMSGKTYHRARVVDNVFKNSWGISPGGQDYFGAIKFESMGAQVGYPNIYSRGHVISNNTIINTSQMGIELWGFMEDSVVSNNSIELTQFGISVANNSTNITVNGNSVKGCALYGIEAADSFGTNIIGNTVDGTTGNLLFTYDGIIVNGVNVKPCSANVVGNTIRNCAHSCIINFAADGSNIVGNTLIQTGRGAANFYNQGSSHVNFSNNRLSSETGVYFIMLDDDSLVSSSGITIANNDFNGTISDWGILYYNNNNIGNNTQVLIENNRTYGVRYCGYGMVGGGPAYGLHRNNFGQSGNLGYIISDAQFPAGSSPYGTSNIKDGYQFYNKTTLTIPNSGIPISSGGWVNIWSGDDAGNILRTRFIVKYSSLGPPYTYDGKEENMEFAVSLTPYGLTEQSITVEPQGNYLGNVINQIVLDNPGQANISTVWLNLISGSTATSGYLMDIYGSDGGLVLNPVIKFNRPPFEPNSLSLNVANYSKADLKLTRGFQMGNGVEFYSPSSGELGAFANNTTFFGNVYTPYGNLGIGTTTPQTKVEIKSAHNTNPILAVYNSGDNIFLPVYEGNAPSLSTGNTAYMAIGKNRSVVNQFSLGFFYAGDALTTNRLDFGAYGINPIMSLTAGSKVGIGTVTPGSPLEVYSPGVEAIRIRGDNSLLGLYKTNGVRQGFLYGPDGNISLGSDTGHLSLVAGGGTKIYIDAGGFVGVNTSSPQTIFDVYGGTSRANTTISGAAAIEAYGSNQYFQINNTGAGLDKKYWRWGNDDGRLTFEKVNDAYNSTSRYFVITPTGNVGIGITTPTHLLQLGQDDAAKPTSSTWTTTSDQRIKTDIQSINVSGALGLIEALRPVQFRYIPAYLSDCQGIDRLYFNFIAQEVENIFPHSVKTTQDSIGAITGIKTLDNHDLIVHLVAAVQELSNQVKTLKIQCNP